MPKNPNLNIARYKVAGGELNEFEFTQNQQALVEQQHHDAENLIPGTPPAEMTPQSTPETSERRGGLGPAAAKSSVRLPPRTKRTASKKGSVSQKGREKSTKKSAKSTKPAKRSAASKRRPAKKAAKRSTKKATKRSTKKAAKKTGTKKKARK